MIVSWRALLHKKQFLPLFLTQFFGAFNDNAYKLAMLTLISYHLSATQSQSEHYQAIAGALYTLPFFLFSATAGQLADKLDKAILTRWVKFFELILMIIGGISLYNGSILSMMLVLTGMGIHSTFFGPIKYAILPDHLPREQLMPATGLIEASTFIAILLGTTLGALAIGDEISDVIYAVILTNTIAILGLISSLFIPSAYTASPLTKVDWRLWRATKNMLVDVVGNRAIFPAVFAISWFWLIGAVMLTKLPDYTHYVLGADTSVFALFLALFSIGIALGSLSISYFLKDKITLKYVPLAMIFLSLFAFDLYWSTPLPERERVLLNFGSFFSQVKHWRIIIDFFFFSFCGGLFIVPLYTYLQVVSKEGRRAQTIAANNICNAFAMVVGSLLVMLMLYFNFSIMLVFLMMAIFNVLAAAVLWFLLIRLLGNNARHA